MAYTEKSFDIKDTKSTHTHSSESICITQGGCITVGYVLYNKQQDNQVNSPSLPPEIEHEDAESKNSNNLTKRDLVVRISGELNLIQQDVFNVIQKTLDYITESLATGNNVELRNFGVFEVRLTQARVGRNPNKPERDVVIPARATVKFKAGKIMKARVLELTEKLKHSGESHHGSHE